MTTFSAISRQCPDCGVRKALTEFHKDATRKNGRKVYCKACNAAQVSSWSKADPERRARVQRQTRLNTLYGVTPKEFDAMLDAQGNGCEVCYGVNADGRSLAVDHDHKTGKVRALLCSRCNIALGLVEEDPCRLRALADYVERFGGKCPA